MLTTILMLASSVQQIHGCPATIRDTQAVVAEKSWSVLIAPGARTLDGAMLFSGNPSKRRSLQPVPKGQGIMRWSFAGEEIWVECTYSGSSAILTKNLGRLASCVYTPGEAGTADASSLVCEKRK